MEPVIWDEWNFAHRQCTSFVSWRLNQVNKVPFSNQYKGLYRWGNAADWAASARSVGIRVDTTPEIGAVAWSGAYYKGASWAGHVAWVADVLSDGRVVIEEYNYGWAGAYYTRTIQANDFQGYIHVSDLTQAFSQAPKPTISGVPMVGGTLTVSASGWSPRPDTTRYQWFAGGTAVSGATGTTFQPRLADLGKRITVEVTGDKPRYRPTTVASTATAAVMMVDSNGNGIDDTQEMMPWNSDVNGDGLPDAVGFGSKGVSVALRTKTGFGPARTWVAGFGTGNGWSTLAHPRALIDVNGDGKSDVVGFAEDGVYVALSTGSGFGAAKRWSAQFGAASGWSVQHHPRTLVDVNGDGRPDIVGFASNGVHVALNTGSSFAGMTKWYDGFGTAKGWTVDTSPRMVADMNGDGLPDIVGISKTGVYVALNTGTRFAAMTQWSSGFGRGSGWSTAAHPRTLADVNGDGRPDLVGFATNGVYVALNGGTSLQTMRLWRAGLGNANGWRIERHPRILADVNRDGLADVVGFDHNGVVVALSTGSGFTAPKRWSSEFGAKDWSTAQSPRFVTDTNGDGRADIVGFSSQGIQIATSTGKEFGASQLQYRGFGLDAGGWKVAGHPRAMGIYTLGGKHVPTISGQVRVGQRLTAHRGTWYPKPVRLTPQWLRNGQPIPQQTGTSYTLTRADLGAKISYRVRGTKTGYMPITRVSSGYTVLPGQLTVSAAPTVTGTAKVGRTLTALPRTWRPQPVTLKYQWYRNGSKIPGATQVTYKLTRADAGQHVRVTVIGAKSGYTTKSRVSKYIRVAK
ncbi:CHAP domain-containing protein [Leucobacter luti]|nr:CHAP domain-containing protein [Leucobacter luti]